MAEPERFLRDIIAVLVQRVTGVLRLREVDRQLAAQGHERHPRLHASLAPAGAVGQSHAFLVKRHGDVADFHREPVRAFVNLAAGEDEAAAQPGARRDEEHRLSLPPAHGVFAESGRVAVIRHEHRPPDLRREFSADVHAHPVGGEIGASPDDAVAGGRGHVHADRRHSVARDAGAFAEFIEREMELPESLRVARIDMAAHFDDGADLCALAVHEDRFDGGAADIEAGGMGGGIGHGMGSG
jgi:hypothetical protein